MNVDTGAFQAVTAQVTEMADEVAELRRDFDANRIIMQVAFDAGHAAGRESVTGRGPTVRRPRHLTVVGDPR